MNDREKWVFSINFLKTKQDPSVLRREKKWEELSAVLNLVREGIPNHYALSDRVMYKFAMEQIINLRILGWAEERWKMYDEYAKDPNEFERVRQYWVNITPKKLNQDKKEEISNRPSISN